MAKQLYMIEILIDKVSIFVREDDEDTDTKKKFVIRMKVGPKDETIFHENHLADVSLEDAIMSCDDQQYDRKWTRTIRVGKSYLFSSYPEKLVVTLAQFPIELQMYTDSDREITELIGNGLTKWDSRFYAYLKANANPFHLHEPFAFKQTCVMYHDILPGRAGEIDIILRLSALGQTITSEFQQIPGAEPFVFRTNRVPTMFLCERKEGDDINFLMVGNVYETITLEDPEVVDNMNQKIEVCTELESCCPHGDDNERRIPLEFVKEKLKMKDIVGPCGNSNCPLAHKIKTYLRTLDIYKKASKGAKFADKNKSKEGRNVCGKCGCKEDRWHRETCPELDKKPVCTGCGGIAKSGETCEDRIKKYNKEKDKEKEKQVNYMTKIVRDPESKKSIFGQTFIVNPCDIHYPATNFPFPPVNNNMPPRKYCTCGQNTDLPSSGGRISASTSRSMGNISALVYNADVKAEGKNTTTKFCTDMPEEKDKECKCNPPLITPPCKTFDCECLIRAEEKETRRKHKSYCPAYKHKPTCPVTKMNDEEVPEFEEEDVETLPYGLPPVQVGPCPVLGRPCSVPDGFARMYRTAAMPTQPLSYSEAGKICCSAEFDRVKKAILEYMKTHEKEDDYRCLNRLNFDGAKKCCDKEQRLLALLGKSCCGSGVKTHDIKDKSKKK